MPGPNHVLGKGRWWLSVAAPLGVKNFKKEIDRLNATPNSKPSISLIEGQLKHAAVFAEKFQGNPKAYDEMVGLLMRGLEIMRPYKGMQAAMDLFETDKKTGLQKYIQKGSVLEQAVCEEIRTVLREGYEKEERDPNQFLLRQMFSYGAWTQPAVYADLGGRSLETAFLRLVAGMAVEQREDFKAKLFDLGNPLFNQRSAESILQFQAYVAMQISKVKPAEPQDDIIPAFIP